MTSTRLVLELVEGPTLAERIAADPPSVNEALTIGSYIAEALEAAHEKGIIHRDLKPANIKVTSGGRVKVLDFGLAKTFDDEAAMTDLAQAATMTGGPTHAGVILGTAAYMSPEQTRGKPVDKRTDIWAFGCVLYEMLAGRRPFVGETMSDVMAGVLEREPNWDALPAANAGPRSPAPGSLPGKGPSAPPAGYRRRTSRVEGDAHSAESTKATASREDHGSLRGSSFHWGLLRRCLRRQASGSEAIADSVTGAERLRTQRRMDTTSGRCYLGAPAPPIRSRRSG